MALIISIPIKSKADGTYYSYGDHEITYNGYLYGFYITSASTSGLPNNYHINQEVFEEIISSDAKGLQYDLANRADTHGIVIAEWILNGVDSFANFIFGSYANYLQATGSFIHDFIWSGATTYSWNYYFTGADSDYPGSGDYGTAYGFRFIGAAGEKFDIVLDEYGDYYGHNLVGNWTPSEDPAPTNWILINQGLDNFYVPSISGISFNDLNEPYIKGNKLYFTVYEDSYESLVYIDNFEYCALGLSFNLGQNNPILSYPGLILLDSKVTSNTNRNVYFSDGSVYKSMGYTNRNVNFSHNNNVYSSRPFDVRFTKYSAADKVSLNLPSLNLGYIGSLTSLTYDSTQVLGCYNSSFVNGSIPVIWLESFSYTVNPDPNPFPEDPVPITSIPEDPEDPIPQTTPDPVPGIEYPVNPTPPPLRPVPSIVSGNDDLWTSVIELQNIEIDLSGYLSSLGDFEFPDLSTITESFASSIVWVSALMSTFFNGSDFSILFAVLSSFFIVAALLGLYKWWNHK